MNHIKRPFPLLAALVLMIMLAACRSAPAADAPPASAPLPSAAPTRRPADTATVTAVKSSPTAPDVDTPTPEATGAPAQATAHPYCPAGQILLDIPDRDEDEIAPEEGWCGEVSIQTALEYYGKTVSQSAVHAAGNPQHPDLWEDDIPVALDTLGAVYESWDAGNPDLHAYMTWIGEELRQGHPLILGVKIYPDETGWDNDHFVLAVGCDEQGLYINTNNAGDGQYYASFEELTQNFADAYSFVNADDAHYGWSVQGLR